MAVDFGQLLNVPADDIKAPPTLPAGLYRGFVKSTDFGTSKNKGTPYVRFNLAFTEATEGVDQDALTEVDLSKVTKTFDFFITEDARYRLKDFLVGLGIQSAGRQLSEMVPEAVGENVLINIVHDLNRDDPEKPPYARVSDVKPDKS